jgi:transposase
MGQRQRDECLTTWLRIPGWYVAGTELRVRKGRSEAVLELDREEPRYTCGRCGHVASEARPWRVQELQHLPLWEHVTILRVQKHRVACPTCGLKAERLPWAIPYARVTLKLAALVGELCKVLANSAVALLLWLHPGTVKTLDKRAIQAAQAARALDGITTLGFDEIAVGRGQTYWHLVHALDGPRGPECLFVGEGRKEKDLKRFWRWFGKPRARQITHAVMDMWKAFRRSVEAHCPGVQVIYDKFHVIRHLLEALNTVRKQEFKRAGKTLKGLLCGKKFLLLSRLAHIRGKAREALTRLLGANRRLLKAHLLKESFGHLWAYRSKTWARKFFASWVAQLKWSRLEPYQKFARMVEKHLNGILAYCDKKVSLGYIEGSNLKARNIIRRAYGYRDKEYMKLKLIQGCSSLGVFRPWAYADNIPS